MKLRRIGPFLLIAVMLALAVGQAASAVGGAAFTTFNPYVDGASKDVCKNSIINCNIYGAKEYVWLNGGPDANHLKPDGWYFFTVLEPGGQPDPNDQGGIPDKNLSDDYDLYTNRTFRTEGGEVVECSGTHDLDSGTPPANGNKTRDPDGAPPTSGCSPTPTRPIPVVSTSCPFVTSVKMAPSILSSPVTASTTPSRCAKARWTTPSTCRA